jgi:transposase
MTFALWRGASARVRTATRMLAIANALDGMSWTQAARLVGLERQGLRDAVLRFNAEGLTGLRDRLKPGRPPTLKPGRAGAAARQGVAAAER